MVLFVPVRDVVSESMLKKSIEKALFKEPQFKLQEERIVMNARKLKWLVFVASMWMLNTIDDFNANIIETPADTEVCVGSSTYLNCSISDVGLTEEVSWFHYPLGTGAHDLRYVYANTQMFEPYNRRFRIEKNQSTGSFNLIITQAEVQDAGSYVCDDGRKSATSQLIILESNLDCKSNINSSGFIGPNVCGLQKETIQLSCAINYTGNIAPMLQWWRLKQGNWLAVQESSCSAFDGRITCNYITEADTELDESYFICHSNRSRNSQDKCETEAVKILYAFANDTQTVNTVGETVTCAANTNSVCCNYTWFYSEGVHYSFVSGSQSLSLKNTGWYRCEANCSIKSQECSFNTMTVKADAEPETSYHNVIIAILSGSVAALFVAVLILLCHNRKLKNSKRNESSGYDSCIPLMANKRKEKQSLPERHRHINPLNEHLLKLKCRAEPLIYEENPKLKHNMKANEKAKKAIYGIAILKDMVYAVRKDCEMIEIYSLTDFKYKDFIRVNEMISPYDIISYDAKNSLFIDDTKEGNAPNEIIRVTPKEKDDQKCRWSITEDVENKTRIEIGRLSLTHDGNILIPLMNESRLWEFDCDGQLIREIKILLPDETFQHVCQAILLKEDYFLLSLGDGGNREKQGIYIGKMQSQVHMKTHNPEVNAAEYSTKYKIPANILTPEVRDIKNAIKLLSEVHVIPKVRLLENSGIRFSELEKNTPNHTITLDDLSILVADKESRSVLLFHVETTSEAEIRLKFQRELLSGENGLSSPYRLYLDKTSGCLFVADNEEIKADGKKKAIRGRILVYSVI